MKKTPRESLIPNSTQVPNVLLDKVFPRLPTADHERVMRYICRRTFGFGKKSDRIGLMQFAKGIKSTKTGEQLDYGAGCSYSTARRCLDDLCKAGLVQKQYLKNGSANGYRINYDIDPDEAVERAHKAWKQRNAVRHTSSKQGKLFPNLKKKNPAPQADRVPAKGADPLSRKGATHPVPALGQHKTKGNKDTKYVADATFDFDKELEKLLVSDDRAECVMHVWFKEKGLTADNEKQLESMVKRNLKPANLLTGYALGDIAYTIRKLAKIEYLKRFTLETVGKFIDDILADKKKIGPRILKWVPTGNGTVRPVYEKEPEYAK